MKKVTMALVSGLFVLALCLVLPLSANAADKLIVKDAGGTADVFKVDDTGKVTAVTQDGGDSNRGFISSQNYNGPTAAVFNYQRSRGTQAAPTALINGDSIGAFHFKAYDGSAYQTVSSIVSKVNGTVSAGSVPGELWFHTGNNGSNNFAAPKMTINTAGTIMVNSLKGTYAGGRAFVCVDNLGRLVASETACP